MLVGEGTRCHIQAIWFGQAVVGGTPISPLPPSLRRQTPRLPPVIVFTPCEYQAYQNAHHSTHATIVWRYLHIGESRFFSGGEKVIERLVWQEAFVGPDDSILHAVTPR